MSEVGFGAWGIGGGWGPTDDSEAERALRRAVELGVTFFDTALGYGDGHSEKLIGRVAAQHRDRMVLATKIPPKTYRWPVLSHEPVGEIFPADWIVACTERSLKNLAVDCIDVQQLHAWTDGYTNQDEWYEALVRLREQGKVRAFGVSANDWDPYGPVRLAASGRVDTVQVIYNIFERRPAEKLFPAALAAGVGIIVRVPFEEGLLSGAIVPGHVFAEGDWRAEWLTPERLEEAGRRVERLRELLRPEAPTLPALALRFALAHPAVSTVIPGMRRVAHVEANCAVSDGRSLPEGLLAELRQHQFAHGWAYPWSQAG